MRLHSVLLSVMVGLLDQLLACETAQSVPLSVAVGLPFLDQLLACKITVSAVIIG